MATLRRRASAVFVAALTAATIPLSAQLGAPNAAGVSIGHVHLTVRNPEEHKKLWLLLGAQVTMAGPLELLKFPGLFVILTKGEPAGGSEGSTVNHFGFMVRSVDEVKARLTAVGLPTVQELTNPKRWVTMLPDAVKVEFTEEPSLSTGIIGHHLHLSTNDLEPLRALEAAGVTFEVPYREVAQLGLKLAFIVDPVGTRIELTEGLAGR